MRAAWAALETQPDLNVTVVNQQFGPSGSSFANINDKLGMQVCRTDRERENYVREAISIAAPGVIDPDLVRILAEESEARFLDLETIGFPFDRDEHQDYFRTTGCFSPREKRAVVFTGLSVAFGKLKNKFLSLGGCFMEGWLIQDLVKLDQQCTGRICRSGAAEMLPRTVNVVAVTARSVSSRDGRAGIPFYQKCERARDPRCLPRRLLKRAGAANLVNTHLIFNSCGTKSRNFDSGL